MTERSLGGELPTLVLVCKRPALGHGKQRLAATLGTQRALEIARALLDCALEDLRHWPGPTVIAPDEAAHDTWAAELAPFAECLAQAPGNLGERLLALDRSLRQRGHRQILYIGSDAPALTEADYRHAAAALGEHDSVLIDAADGGVVLMGSRRAWPALADLPWSSAELGRALAERLGQAGFSLAHRAGAFDVDEAIDLPRLEAALANDARPARQRLLQVLREPRATAERCRLAVVIPCLHDELPLQRLLAQLAECSRSSDLAVRIVVVDGAASEGCRQLCARYNALWLPAEPCRGEQLNLGASGVDCPWLWFLHADARLEGDPLSAIRDALHGGAAGGCFAFRFAGRGCWQSRLLERLIGWRARFGVPYGDQGLFATRAAYEAAGGHAAWPLFEEVPLVRELRRQGDFVLLGQGLAVDPRRWQRDGWWRRSLRNRLLALGFALGLSPWRLARRYGAADTSRRKA